MTQTVDSPRSPRPSRILGVLIAALSLAVGTSCSHPAADNETASVTFFIRDSDVLRGGQSGGQGPRAQDVGAQAAFSFNDVLSIKITVSDLSTNPATVLITHFDLKRESSGWTATLTSLPKNKSLLFNATAYKSNVPSLDARLFTGDTTLSLESNEPTTVRIALAAINDKQEITLPRVALIGVPPFFTAGQSNNITFAVEGPPGATLSYSLRTETGDATSGTFYPASGSIGLKTTSLGSFVSQYQAPSTVSNSSGVSFQHKVTVTNEAGHSITTSFKTVVKPPGRSDSAPDTSFSVVFAPVFQTLNASRIEGTGDVVFTVDVKDDTEEGRLAYAWSFAPDGTYSTPPSFTGNNTTRVGILHDYTPSVRGQVVVTVTDTDYNTTTLKYPLTANQFPDKPTDEVKQDALLAIRAGNNHTCALFNNGDVRCWGLGDTGALGYGTPTSVGDSEAHSLAKAPRVPFTGKAVKLALGFNHTCALMDSGYVACWGNNQYGQLGYATANALDTNNIGDNESITKFGYVNLGGAAVKISAGGNHTCALMDTGRVRCWGSNNFGQLGLKNSATTPTVGINEQPVARDFVSLGELATDIVSGENHNCALLASGRVRCWGYNNVGQLGYGNTTTIGDDELPSAVGPVGNLGNDPVLQISAGANHTCAVLSTGNLRCWGYNQYGQLGNGQANCDGVSQNCPRNTNALSPGADIATGGRVIQVAGGFFHTCALLESGAIKCWGNSYNGQAGWATTAAPDKALDFGGTSAFQIATGVQHTCVLLSTGKARCWGYNGSGQLGYNNTITSASTTNDLKFAP